MTDIIDPRFSETVAALQEYSHALPLSYSKINTLLNCPRMYRKRYIEKAESAEPPQKEVQVVGSFAHKVLELCLQKGQGFGWDLEVIDFDLVWMQVARSMKLTHQEFGMAQAIRSNTEHVFERLVAAIKKYNLVVYPELMFAMDQAGKVRPRVPWKSRFFFGYIDYYAETRQRTRALVVDFKSGKKTKDGAARTQAQLENYAHCLFIRNPKLQSIQLGGAYLPDEDIDLSVQITRNSAEHRRIIDSVYDFYGRFIAALATGDFAPTPGKFCSWCGYTAGCEKAPGKQ